MAGDEDDEYGVPEDVIPDYDPKSTFYTLKLWYGGQVVIYDGVLSYMGGEVQYVDYVDYDKTSIMELDVIVRDKLNFVVGAIYYIKVPGSQNLQLVENDDGLIRALDRTLLIGRVVEIYCSHPINEAVLTQADGGPKTSKKKGTRQANVGTNEEEQEEDVAEEDRASDDFRDSDYEQSDEEEEVDAEVEINLEGLSRRNKGKGIDIEEEGGFDIEESESDVEEEYASRKYVDSSDTEEDDCEAEIVGSSYTRSRRRPKRKLPPLPEFNPSTDRENPVFQLGLLFPSADSFRKAIRMYALKAGKDIYFRRNESGRVRACCSKLANSCPWTCFASRVSGSSDFMVKTFVDIHTCGRQTSNRFAKASWLATTYADQLKVRKGWDVHEFIRKIRKDYVVEVSVQKAYLTRRIALGLMESIYNEQFKALWDYAEEIKLTNPGSTVTIKSRLSDDGLPQFERIYICFTACKSGFKAGCRRIVGLDGTHLKGYYKGQLLTAIGVDANNSMYPISFAVVESECKDSWTWFLELLRQDLEIHNSHHWSFISDKQKGLEQALKDMWTSEQEQAEHRHCARHVQANFVKAFKGQALKLKMMAAAYSSTEAQFKNEMEEIKKLDTKAYDWLMSKGPTHWSRAFFRTSVKCDILLNNLCESFNGTTAILTARERPILSLLERVRMYILQRHTKQRVAGGKWSCSIGPRISKILEKGKVEAARNVAYWCGGHSFQVLDGQGEPYGVQLEARTCSCRKWDLSGIPCSHAIACIWLQHANPEDYVHDHYKKEAHQRSYAQHMLPIRQQAQWPESGNIGLKPPEMKKQPGRPKKSRRIDPDEVLMAGRTKISRGYNTNHCKSCGLIGHNSRTCLHKKTTCPRNPEMVQQHDRRSQAMPEVVQRPAPPTQTSPTTHFKQRAGKRVVQPNKKSIAKKGSGHHGSQSSQLTQEH